MNLPRYSDRIIEMVPTCNWNIIYGIAKDGDEFLAYRLCKDGWSPCITDKGQRYLPWEVKEKIISMTGAEYAI